MTRLPLPQPAATVTCPARHRGFVLASVLAATLLPAACSISHRWMETATDCVSLARDAVPFDTSLANHLTGEYALVRADTISVPGRSTPSRGRLTLWAPGVSWRHATLHIGDIDSADGRSEELAVEWVSTSGFGGRWTSNTGIAIHADSTGRAFGPGGHYCARRLGGSLGATIRGTLSDSATATQFADYPLTLLYRGGRTGDGLAGARMNPPFSRETRTDDTGAFRFDGVPPARYRVLARGILLEPIVVDVEPTPGDTIRLALAFRPRKPPPEDPARRGALLASLDSARQRWNSYRPARYEAVIELYCFCIGNGPITVEVWGDSVVRATDSTGQSPAEVQRFSVDGLFRAIEGEMRDDHRRIMRTRYDPLLGYPVNVRTDTPFGVTDLWMEYRVLSLRAIN